jgi:hypothetical protein
MKTKIRNEIIEEVSFFDSLSRYTSLPKIPECYAPGS